MGSHCICVSPVPDSIMMGSPTVFIGGVPAARLFDPTLHGGSIVFGAATVLIGEFAAVGAVTVFPGQQHFGNCGVQSSQQLIHQATGQNPDEHAILGLAIAGGYAANSAKDSERGATSANARQALLKEYGVGSTIIINPSDKDLAEALKDNKGVIAAVDAGELWGNSDIVGSGHAIVITEGDFNENGDLSHVYINDTGTGQQGRRMSVSDIRKAFDTYRKNKGTPSINVTDSSIWTRIR